MKVLVPAFHVGMEPGPLPLECGGHVPNVVELAMATGLYQPVALQQGFYPCLYACNFLVIITIMFTQQLKNLWREGELERERERERGGEEGERR